MRRLVAIALLVAWPVRAQAFVADAPAPPSYAPLIWRHAGVDAPGYWFTAAQVQRIDARIVYLTDRAAAECFDKQQAETKRMLGGGTIWLVVGGLALGLVGGWAIAKATR